MIDGPLKTPEERNATQEEIAKKAIELGVSESYLTGATIKKNSNGSFEFVLELSNFWDHFSDATFEENKDSQEKWRKFKEEHKDLVESVLKGNHEIQKVVSELNSEEDKEKRQILIKEIDEIANKNRPLYQEAYFILAKMGIDDDLMRT